MVRTLRQHAPEIAIEGALLGLFMVSAGLFGTLFDASRSPFAAWLPTGLPLRALMGVAMGATAIALIHSPWGKRSGAHMNPAVTWTFYRLGKIGRDDALLYTLGQCAGGLVGVLLVAGLLGDAFLAPPVRAVATVPGPLGAGTAFWAEVAIAALQMVAVLFLANGPRAHLTGRVAGLLVALDITFEAPLSGMSMNPARSFASALPGGVWDSFWVYLTAPFLGMLAGAQLYLAVRGAQRVYCAKLDHRADHRCIFLCRYGDAPATDSDVILRSVPRTFSTRRR